MPVSKKITPSENLKADIVVIGAGGAGLAAAGEAAGKGAKVIIIEKRHTAGGNSVFAEGFFAAESLTQKRLKIDARRDDLFKIAIDFSHYTLNPRIIRAYIDKSGETADWLEKKGLSFEVPMLYPNQTPATWHVPKHGGAAVVKVLLKNCKDLGVQLLCNTAAKSILIDEHGHAIGVIAETRGKRLQITAKSIIITTGGYTGNKKLMRKYFPNHTENVHLVGIPHTGDGLIMATDIGADTESLGVCMLGGPYVTKGKSTKGLSWSLPLMAVASEPNIIWVNKKGERFVDECICWNMFKAANAQLRQPGQITYSLFDEKIKQNIEEQGVIKGVGVLFVPPRTKISNLGKLLESRTKDRTVTIADSWDDIAKGIGAAPEVLKSTIAEYNRFCDQGHDEIFAKDQQYLQALREPPYYALAACPSYTTTLGGIKVNHRMEVINKNDEIIPGLFAGGDTVGGWESETYCGILSGSGLGFCLNSGRIAGESAAKYITESYSP